MDPAFRFRRFPWSALAAGLAFIFAQPVGCGDDAAQCVSSRCPKGNECVDDGSGKGAVCHQTCTASSQCPFNSYCNDGQPKSWCVESTFSVPQKPAGQWLAACLPTGGETNNPGCDAADGFWCYGTSPTDANSFCTVFGCTADTDCPGGWWCGRVNEALNILSNSTSYGPTRTVCLPRTYCAPCKLDHDCPAATDGTQQHCAQDSQGNGYCASECSSDANCPLDATCKTWQSLCTPAVGASCNSDDDCPALNGVFQHCDGSQCTPECAGDSDCAGTDGGASGKCQIRGLCAPRAGSCVGNGGFCSPCRSDADCTNGYCISGAPYSTERFCSVKSTHVPCDTTHSNPAGCPAHTASDNWAVNACVMTPANQCEAFVALGSSTGSAQAVPGCWTRNR
jgi:hypothetical protein